jgi:tRNA threonylcarbamoyl adenosine modification protein (Sua5/YciO/YrdC/YwlC family)
MVREGTCFPQARIIREPVSKRSRAMGCRVILAVANKHPGRAPVRVEMVKINSEAPEPSLIRYAADHIRAGEILGMPTDTFYGLAADPFNLRAVERVYEIKSRSRHKPLSLLIEDVEQAEELAKPLPEEFRALAKKFWPGPLTIIVKAASRLPLKVTANTGNVALRVPNAKIPLAVVQAARIPVTATSANLSGATECTTAEAVRDQLGVRIPIIVDGGTSPREVASTIVDLTDEVARWKILREGAIPSQEISEFFAQG